ncbi:MAG: LysM peptidoglycan-binding domain-containing protein [Candidatus Omnitrophica bacterium]|nr:LysM peptidoglycan-binding domain-containing protein [Candidatus Omnitrophota bacterium]
MKNAALCCILLGMFFISGCVIRTYTVEMERVDQEISGNRGVIMGTPPAVSETEQVKKTRTIYNVEVELPSGYKTTQEVKDKELYGNRGYVRGNVVPEKEVYVTESGKGQVPDGRFNAGLGSSRMPQIVYSEPSSDAGISASGAQKEYYVVQKGDTLQKISQKLFGTTQKWQSIYDANKHVLKSPDRIRPGQKLAIPK